MGIREKTEMKSFRDSKHLELKGPRKTACLFIYRRALEIIKMYLMYYLDEKGERVYTFSKVDPAGKPTISAHPAKFSPEDKYSRERIIIKKRFGILPTQLPPLKY